MLIKTAFDRTENPRVGGSIPPLGTTFLSVTYKYSKNNTWFMLHICYTFCQALILRAYPGKH